MTDYPRGHDMSEMGHLTLPGATAEYIAKLEARVAELEISEHENEREYGILWTKDQATIRRLSDENAALKALLCDLGMGIPKIYPDDPLPAHQYRDGNGDVQEITGAPTPNAIYGTDFPECPSSAITQERFNEKMDELDRQNPEAELNARKICGLPPLVTRWRNGKRYELTPEDAKRFDEDDE